MEVVHDDLRIEVVLLRVATHEPVVDLAIAIVAIAGVVAGEDVAPDGRLRHLGVLELVFRRLARGALGHDSAHTDELLRMASIAGLDGERCTHGVARTAEMAAHATYR